MGNRKFRTITIFLSVLILIGIIKVPVEASGNIISDEKVTDYSQYIKDSALLKANGEIRLSGGEFSVEDSSSSVKVGKYQDAEHALIWESNDDSVTYHFTVEEAALYNIEITYQVISYNANDFEFGLMIDGKYPFEETKMLKLPQMWKNADVKNTDSNGNEYAPEQVVSNSFATRKLFDSSGAIVEDLQFAFSAGNHTVTLIKKSGAVVISDIALSPPEVPAKYNEILKEYTNKGYSKYSGEPIFIEGEDAVLKTSRSLVPKCDNSSVNVHPNDAVKSVMNYIGDSNWSGPCEELSWTFDAPQDGLYRIGFNYKQDKVINGFSYRNLKIDGKIPFEETKCLRFDYGTNWQFMSVEDDGQDYLFYFTKGKHTISMAVTLGEVGDYYLIMKDMVEEIGSLYLDIVTITGTSPDANRDYELFKQIPDFNKKLTSYQNTLNQLAENMKSLSGKRSSQYIAAVNNMARVLNSMIENPYTAHNYISDYYSNYTTLGSWLSEMTKMPLSLDRIEISAPDAEQVDHNSSFMESVVFAIKRFFVSFNSDYNNISDATNTDGPALKIWVNWGRDQAMVLNSLIQESFVAETGIGVNLELTNASLIKGILSGISPDLSLHLSRTEPVNLAMRGALYDLNNFDDYSEVMKRFGESAGEPYSYKGGNYALPDTQAFYIMFYRTDVFEKFNLTVPSTWDEFIDTMVAIQRNNLQVYLPYVQITDATTVNTGFGGLNLFPSVLMQQGVSIYDDSLTCSMLDSTVSHKVFSFWTDLYTKYKVPTVSSFYNRFRVGTTPLGIETYTTYTTLIEAAPEIYGKWDIAMVPGTIREDGTVDHTVSGSGTGCSILQASQNKEAAWEFLKWWTSAEVQLKYNNNVESILGPVSRTTTANLEAFSNMSWDNKHLDTLLSQREWIKEIPEVPGSYYLSRAVDQAFWEVYNKKKNPKETLNKWNGVANSEISRKIKEYSN